MPTADADPGERESAATVSPAPAAAASRPAGANAAPVPPRKQPKAGRNLTAAIATGLIAGAVLLASLLIERVWFTGIAAAASVIGTIELLTAFSAAKIRPPLVPTMIGAAVIPVAAYWWGPHAAAVAALLTVLGVLLWGATGRGPHIARDVAGGALVTLYVPGLISFAMLLLRPEDGAFRIITFLLVVFASDIGGYAAGVFFGRHPMAPTVSPKKSWEGFAGSAASCIVVGALCVALLLDGPWWLGGLLGALVVVAATVGDLCESMIKRDLGIKDMSQLIPGHGGVMDRLDSLVLAAPVTWALLTFVGS